MNGRARRAMVEVRIPPLARPDDNARLLQWHRLPGQPIAAGDVLADLETDKVTLEVSAPVAGVLAEALVPEGAEVGAGELIALVRCSSTTHPTPVDPVPIAASPAAPAPAAGRELRVPMTRIRARIAENLVRARMSQALVTTFNEIDMTAIAQLRAMQRTVRPAGPGYLPFFVRAALVGLRRFPNVNAVIDGPDVIYRDGYHIGIAVATRRGVVVPVIHDADRKTIAALDTEINALAARARTGRMALSELAGATFSVTNGGVYGSLLSTPIVGPEQSAILGMHAIQRRAVVVGDTVVVRPMMYLALTYDHRLVDGSEAVRFLTLLKRSLEQPEDLVSEEAGP